MRRRTNYLAATARRERLRGAGALEGPRPALISRIRFQLPGALLVAGITPFLMDEGTSWEGSPPARHYRHRDFRGDISGYYALRKISNFPTMREVGSVIPVFTASFPAVMAVFSPGGFEYSRFPFVAGYMLTVAWFTVVLVLAQRVRKRRFVLVPFGEAARCWAARRDVACRDSPESLPGPCNGVVVDLRAEIPAHWQQFLTSCALAGIPVYHYKHVREAITGAWRLIISPRTSGFPQPSRRLSQVQADRRFRHGRCRDRRVRAIARPRALVAASSPRALVTPLARARALTRAARRRARARCCRRFSSSRVGARARCARAPLCRR